MYRTRPNIYEMPDTLSFEMKEELLEYLKTNIAAEKAAPKKSYLEEQWVEIKRLIKTLKYEPYIETVNYYADKNPDKAVLEKKLQQLVNFPQIDEL